MAAGRIWSSLDAVTVDGYGTLLALRDPIPALASALVRHGVERDGGAVRRAFAAEIEYYRAHALGARDERTLRELRLGGTSTFLRALGTELEAGAFVDDFVGSLVFEPIPGAVETVDALRRRGLRVGLVANWDFGLHEHLRRLGLTDRFLTVVVSAEIGAAKPDPAPFHIALDRLGAEPARALHIGDDPADEAGARAAGMRFAWAPLADAFEGWT